MQTPFPQYKVWFKGLLGIFHMEMILLYNDRRIILRLTYDKGRHEYTHIRHPDYKPKEHKSFVVWSKRRSASTRDMQECWNKQGCFSAKTEKEVS